VHEPLGGVESLLLYIRFLNDGVQYYSSAKVKSQLWNFLARYRRTRLNNVERLYSLVSSLHKNCGAQKHARKTGAEC